MSLPDEAPWKDPLRQARIERNWRQYEVAEQIGASVLTVQRWERGSHRPSVYFQLKLCTLFGKSAKELGFVPPGQPLSDPPTRREAECTLPASFSSPVTSAINEAQMPGPSAERSGQPSRDEQDESLVPRAFLTPKRVHLSRRSILIGGTAFGVALASVGIWKFFSSLDLRSVIHGNGSSAVQAGGKHPPTNDHPFVYQHADAVEFLSWSPDGKWLASASADKTVQIYDISTGSHVLTYRGHTDTVSGVAFSPDGTHLVSTSLDGTVQMWEAATGEKKKFQTGQSIGADGPLYGASWSIEIPRIACIANELAAILYANTLEFWGSLSDAVSASNAISLAPGAPIILFATIDHIVRTWDISTQIGYVNCPGHTRKVLAVGWSPDGSKAVSGSQDQTVRIWNVPKVTEGQVFTGTSLLVYRGHTDWVQAVSWSPDGSKIASAGRDQIVQVWDASSGQLLFMHHGHNATVNSLAWSPDGTFLASASDDMSVQIWKVR
ncbi:MAG TPA: helix-turn-helix domain-containing protein [Ktedonobacteraceae bacterium]|nr:helix-turn-helix domain-containing protein [Ktedonobacteraceae bacterium]